MPVLAGGFAAGWVDMHAQIWKKCSSFFQSASLKPKVSCSTSGAHGPSRAVKLGSSHPHLLSPFPPRGARASCSIAHVGDVGLSLALYYTLGCVLIKHGSLRSLDVCELLFFFSFLFEFHNK